MLNKEFKRKDVERMRNLIKGKVGESSELQVGFTTKKKTIKKEIFGKKEVKYGLLKIVLNKQLLNLIKQKRSYSTIILP